MLVINTDVHMNLARMVYCPRDFLRNIKEINMILFCVYHIYTLKFHIDIQWIFFPFVIEDLAGKARKSLQGVQIEKIPY